MVDEIRSAGITHEIKIGLIYFAVGLTQSQLRSSKGSADQGGEGIEGDKIGFGARTKAEGFGLRVLTVSQSSPAHQAGLSAGDLLIAADNLQVNAQFEQQLQSYSVGAVIKLHWFRRDELMQGELLVAEAVKDTVSLSISDAELSKLWLL